MNLFRRKRTLGFTFYNRGPSDRLLWLEPWAEEFTIPAGSKLDLIVEGRFRAGCETPFEVSDTHLVFFAPGDSLVRVLLDGLQQGSVSSEIAFPSSDRLSTRELTTILFGHFPEARLAGSGPEAADEE